MTVRVVVSLGTDFHRFDRLVDWIERWAGEHEVDALVTVQHGTSRAPDGCDASPMYPHGELVGLMKDADAVVVQGGPGGIVDSLGVGIRPIVVPRRRDLGEHVDDHQVSFARFMHGRGDVLLAEDEAPLLELLDQVLLDPQVFRVPPRESNGPETARRIGGLVEDLVSASIKQSARI